MVSNMRTSKARFFAKCATMWLMLLGAALAQQRIVYTGVNVRPVVDEEVPVVRIGFAGSIARNAMDREVLNGVKLGMEDARQFQIAIGGKKAEVKLYPKDDGGTREGALEAAEWFVHRQDLVAVIGHISSGLSIAAGPVYDAGGLVLLSPTAASPVFTPQEGLMRLRLSTNDAQQGRAMARYLAKTMGSKKPFLLLQNTAYARELTKALESQLRLEGVDFTVKLEVSGNPMDLMKNSSEIKSAAGRSDAVVVVGFDDAMGQFAKSIRSHGIDVPMLVSDGICTDEFLAEMKDDHKYVCAKGGLPLEKLVLLPSFIDRYKAAYGAIPGVEAALGYDAVKVIMTAIKSAESTDPRHVFRALKSMGVYGITGDLSFDDFGNQKKGVVSFYEARHGGWLPISDVATSGF